ncbi:LOW QUALITY PROTEIN: uncharacterized protein LOC119379105 [Rhipicephalus sanguineus]|uniref:LOW QUALITY PROTEIN: uncharacterized protein LOC119379105 n=1 Tax=Rhipicephalus sanguineus TaxID=34632 RepID=UPI001892DC25|nr:LOW QUALITY PROTEIN: uncharacterized protein LOC119379105 [Rhipicephalus sanguineus]
MHRPDTLPLSHVYQSARLACDSVPSSSSSLSASMSGEKFPDIRVVVGIQYFSDVPASTKCQPTVLGAVVLESSAISADELRRIMCDQLPSLPTHFTFVTKERWPVQKTQEHLVRVSHLMTEDRIVSICRHYEKPRIGVMSTGGSSLGFVFSDYNAVLRQFREAIIDQLHEPKRAGRPEFRFVEDNGWPVTTRQETSLTVLDVMNNRSLFIQMGALPTGDVAPSSIMAPPLSNALVAPRNQMSVAALPADDWEGKRKKSVRFGRNEPKPILISYVRAETAQHALNLKQELHKMNFSVYLDIDEIKIGSDWQDALNYAVSECHLFVPLISPMYGKTQWTNREVKLADVLHKVIIPVNFLETWPPECLAIQFASTQYIAAWKASEHETGQGKQNRPMDQCPDLGAPTGSTPTGEGYKYDYRVWDETNLKRVAKEIAERYRQTVKKEQIAERRSKTSSLKIKRSSHLSTLATVDEQSIMRLGSPAEATAALSAAEPLEPVETKELIVITAHPKQKEMAQVIARMLEQDGFRVWSTTELNETRDSCSDTESIPTNPNTPRELAPIPEGERVFSDTYREANNRILEHKRLSSLREQEAPGYATYSVTEGRSVCRLTSQASDASVVSMLAGEKLEKLTRFQQKAVQAKVVIVLITKEFTASRTSEQQVFYIEHRKHVVLVKCDDCPIPCWFTSLMGNDIISRDNPEFENILRIRIRRATSPDTSETPKDAAAEATMQCLVSFIKKEIPNLETCVYIAGSSKLQSTRSVEICKEIGKELAKRPNLAVVTGGFFGAPDVVARMFHECRVNNGHTDPRVFHILPKRDDKIFTGKVQQNSDGSFAAVNYGRNLFLGNSVKERESAVARAFDTCIVVEGGPCAAHEVEQFVWSDHFVVPVVSTGGAAGGQFGVPLKILETPHGITEEKWSVLSEKEATPTEVAKAVVEIVVQLKRAMISHTKSHLVRNKYKKLKKRNKHGREPAEQQTTDSSHTTDSGPAPSVKPTVSFRNISHWQRILNYFRKKSTS